MAELDGNLDAVSRTSIRPVAREEAAELARLCRRHKKWFAEAITLYPRAFSEKPSLADSPVTRLATRRPARPPRRYRGRLTGKEFFYR